MNKEEKKMKNYILVLFLSLITLGIYRWVWFFYIADRVQMTGAELGIRIKPGPSITLILKLFGTFILIGPFVANYLVIRNMNRVAREYNKYYGRKAVSRNNTANNNTSNNNAERKMK
jgi:hypothetical protein